LILIPKSNDLIPDSPTAFDLILILTLTFGIWFDSWPPKSIWLESNQIDLSPLWSQLKWGMVPNILCSRAAPQCCCFCEYFCTGKLWRRRGGDATEGRASCGMTCALRRVARKFCSCELSGRSWNV
jgi:hypothetical protein